MDYIVCRQDRGRYLIGRAMDWADATHAEIDYSTVYPNQRDAFRFARKEAAAAHARLRSELYEHVRNGTTLSPVRIHKKA